MGDTRTVVTSSGYFQSSRRGLTQIVMVGTYLSAVLFVLVPWLVMAFPGSDVRIHEVYDYLTEAGTVLIGHVGWGFGVYLALLAGFYALVIGGQYVGAATSDEYRVRRHLGSVAEATTGSLFPVLILVVLGCLGDPANFSVLLFVVPASLLVLFLAAKLGGFVIIDRQMADARESRDWAKGRFLHLQRRRHRGRVRPSPWLVCIAYAVGGAMITALAAAALGRTGGEIILQVIVVGSLGLVQGIACVMGIMGWETGRAPLLRAIEWSWMTLTSCLLLVAATVFWASGRWEGGVLLCVSLVVSVISAGYGSDRLSTWSLRQAGLTLAARSVVRTYRTSQRRMCTLSARVDASPAGASAM